jgi:hypothetical protein
MILSHKRAIELLMEQAEHLIGECARYLPFRLDEP